ncbi:uncharacterized protein LOC117230339 [Bombus vosnesenskii]|uniref:Uncharacterized protein LOC117230339 n=2 Tax=Pyrobombus TaxID=144703 RepID=A0A6J3JTN8_9HYME|nr:uncharacterized protein LOC117154274 [Bombus vancouverensis nearcticus]XP_033185039.1 uncharacterized protein LOC117154274 [Bombus vancouverensis nearcticus]XP_033185040.1 uncharacterized protein LOC117154274 [Bombus vancouverensis nearcticus]XP_033185041.1 uncharacterized protein LOC117154274 [Bombus vancouverensis nearcticus]XP_033185042.1 uncharacterized protein LOC117154274 [Bombus vancouverensis nearcticus]XP_033301033.1 uncharacterized protein LOC117206118 [Bombus bifarius]XP_0333010
MYCIGLALITRIISTYTMSLSILMINLLMSRYFSKTTDEGFFNSVENWGILGFNWLQVLKNLQIRYKAQTAVIFFLVYIVSFLLASAYLALGSISRKPKCAVPWIYLQVISIIDQSVALSIHLTHEQQYDVYDKSIWYIPLCSVYLVFSACIWMIVYNARKEWIEEQRNHTDLPLTSTTSTMQSNNGGGLKSPSFLSQNFLMFDSPRPSPILSK